MQSRILKLLNDEGVSASSVPLSACTIQKPYLLERAGIQNGTVFMIAAPYYTPECEDASVSSYAVARDYHNFFAGLFDRILPILEREFPENKFCGFADHSPIDERRAAARAGLGVLGKNGLLITKKHSSFIFLGEIICDACLPSKVNDIGLCFGCGICLQACPMTDDLPCLSALTQKKGKLTQSEADYIRKHSLAWGCDICQNVCPYTEAARNLGTIYTDIAYFKKDLLPRPTQSIIQSMSDKEFEERAYSWRGRDCILRNLELLSENKDN